MNNLKNGLTNLNSSGGNINAFNLPTQDQYNSVLNALKGAINVANNNKANNITSDNNSVTVLPNNTLSTDILSTNTNNNIDTTTITSSPYLYMGLFLILVYFIIKK